MITTVEELKSLIIWAKDQKVKKLTLGEISIEISDIAFVDLSQFGKPDSKQVSNNSETFGDMSNLTPQEEEELLFHSSRP